MHVPTMSELTAKGETPEILFWVGCSGSFDQRAQKITKAFATILSKVGLNYAILATLGVHASPSDARGIQESHTPLQSHGCRKSLHAHARHVPGLYHTKCEFNVDA